MLWAGCRIVALDAAMPFDYEAKANARLKQQTALRIGIVGFGTFGQFLAKRLVQQGHKVGYRSCLPVAYHGCCALQGHAALRVANERNGASRDACTVVCVCAWSNSCSVLHIGIVSLYGSKLCMCTRDWSHTLFSSCRSLPPPEGTTVN